LLLTIFRKSYYIQIGWLLVFGIIFASPSFLFEQTLQESNETIFLKITKFPSLLLNPWIYHSLCWTLLLVLVFYIKALLTKHHLVHHSNFLPALIIIALFGFQHPFSLALISILGLFFMAIAYSYLLQSFEDEKADNSIFSASLMIGIASLFSYHFSLFIILVWISFFVFQNYSWRYFPITIIGLITPYLFLITWLFWTDQMQLLESNYQFIQQHFYSFPKFNSIFEIVTISLLGFFIFISLAQIIPEIPGKIIAIRKKTSLSLWFFLVSLIPFLFSSDIIVKNIVLIPLSGLLGYYLRMVKRKVMVIDFLFTALIIILLFQKYYLIYAG